MRKIYFGDCFGTTSEPARIQWSYVWWEFQGWIMGWVREESGILNWEQAN